MTDQPNDDLRERLKKHIERNREHHDPAKQRDAWLAQDALNEIERLSTPAREAAEELLEALEDMTKFYVELVNSGDCGGMDDAETEIEVLATRKLIAKARGEEG